MTPECPECAGHGVRATSFAGGRVVGCCVACRGTGRAGDVPTSRPITLAEQETCESKRWYRTRGKAAKALAVLRRDGCGVIRVYKCPCCRGWHLSSRRPSQKKTDEEETCSYTA